MNIKKIMTLLILLVVNNINAESLFRIDVNNRNSYLIINSTLLSGELINWSSCFSNTTIDLNKNNNECETLLNKNSLYTGSVDVCSNEFGKAELNNQICVENPICGSDHLSVVSASPENLCTKGTPMELFSNDYNYYWKCKNNNIFSQIESDVNVNCTAKKEPIEVCVYDSNNKYYINYQGNQYSGYFGAQATKFNNGTGSFEFVPENNSYPYWYSSTLTRSGSFSTVKPNYITENFYKGALKLKNQSAVPPIEEYEICYKAPLPEIIQEVATICYNGGVRFLAENNWEFSYAGNLYYSTTSTKVLTNVTLSAGRYRGASPYQIFNLCVTKFE